jgi:hypothetical protein
MARLEILSDKTHEWTSVAPNSGETLLWRADRKRCVSSPHQ